MTLKSSKLSFPVSEGTLIYTPAYSKLAIMLPALSLIKVTKCNKKPKILHAYTQHCLNSKVKVLFPPIRPVLEGKMFLQTGGQSLASQQHPLLPSTLFEL